MSEDWIDCNTLVTLLWYPLFHHDIILMRWFSSKSAAEYWLSMKYRTTGTIMQDHYGEYEYTYFGFQECLHTEMQKEGSCNMLHA